ATVEHWKGLANCQVRLGETLQQARCAEDAEQPFRAALAAWKRLADKSPEGGGVIDGLAREHFRLAGLFRTLDRPREAQQAYGEAASHFEQAAKLGPRRDDPLARAAVSHNNRAIELDRLGRSAEAAAEYRASLRVYGMLPEEVQRTA